MGYSKNKDEDRMMRNNLASGQEVPTMVLLVKDHKRIEEGKVVPTLPVVSGNKCINTHLSELLYLRF